MNYQKQSPNILQDEGATKSTKQASKTGQSKHNQKANGFQEYLVKNSDSETRSIWVRGRNRWALDNLIKHGKQGCTPIDCPGPRWSAYVFNLRTKFGLVIETLTEKHGGDYAGDHARYVLHSDVTIAPSVEVAA